MQIEVIPPSMDALTPEVAARLSEYARQIADSCGVAPEYVRATLETIMYRPRYQTVRLALHTKQVARR